MKEGLEDMRGNVWLTLLGILMDCTSFRMAAWVAPWVAPCSKTSVRPQDARRKGTRRKWRCFCIPYMINGLRSVSRQGCTPCFLQGTSTLCSFLRAWSALPTALQLYPYFGHLKLHSYDAATSPGRPDAWVLSCPGPGLLCCIELISNLKRMVAPTPLYGCHMM